MKCDKYFHISFLVGFLLSNPALATCPNPAEPGGQSVEGAIVYNFDHKVVQFCDGDRWVAMMGQALPDCPEDDTLVMGASGWQCSSGSGGGAPTGCDNIGDTCSDGTIYAGLSPDGNVPMYTTPADASSGVYWGTYGFTTGSTSNVTGRDNTADIYAHVQNGDGDYNPDDSYTPNAAVLCEELTAHGHSDWYLPARYELDVLYDNLVDQNGDNTPGGPLGSTFGFNTSGSFPAGYYWSSSEYTINYAWRQSFSAGAQSYNGNKYTGLSVRCVRR